MKHSRKAFALILIAVMVLTMAFATVGVSAASKKGGKVGAVKWNKSKKTVSFEVTVNPKMLDGKAVEHFIINDKMTRKAEVKGQKRGKTSNAGIGLFTTKANALDVYDALVKAGAKPWVAKGSPARLKDGMMLDDKAVAKLSNPKYSHLTMTFKSKDGTVYKPEELVNYEYKGAGSGAENPIHMCFSGNYKNQRSWNSGCVACIFSCYAGITSNAAIGYGTVGEGGDNYFYAGELLKPNAKYTVTYKIVK